MARCETCGNDYDKAFEISAASESHMCDSFECAIQAWRLSARIVAAKSLVMG